MAPQDTVLGGVGVLASDQPPPAPGEEQIDASTLHFFPILVHSASARCSALYFVPDVPQTTVSPSAAMAPQMLWKLASIRHFAPPCLTQYWRASFSAVALSLWS